MCLVKWIFEWRNFDCSFLSWAAAAAEQTLLHTPGRNMRPRRKWRCKAGQRRQRQQLRTCKSSANLAFSPPPPPPTAHQRFATWRRLCGPAIAISFPFPGILFPFLAIPVCLQSPFRLFSRNKYTSIFGCCFSSSFCFCFLFFLLAVAQTFAQIRRNSCINFLASRYLIETEQRNAVFGAVYGVATEQQSATGSGRGGSCNWICHENAKWSWNKNLIFSSCMIGVCCFLPKQTKKRLELGFLPAESQSTEILCLAVKV